MLYGENSAVPQYGYGVPQVAPQEKRFNFLTNEEYDSLKTKVNQFSITPTQIDIARARCNHRDKTGTQDTLVYNPATGRMKCNVCGYEFQPTEVDMSEDAIIEAKNKIIDILQTIKVLYVDFPVDSARELYQILPYLEKIPELYRYAAKNFSEHDLGRNMYNAQYNMGTLAQWGQLQQMFNGGMVTPQFQQPAPQFQPAPAYAAGYPQPAYAGFGAPIAPAPQYAPATAGFQYTPAPTQAPVATTVAAPQAPAAAPETTVKQTVVG